MKRGVRRDHRDHPDLVRSPAGRFFAFGTPAMRNGKRVHIWRFDVWGFLFDPYDGIITGDFAWAKDISPSYTVALRAVWNNLMTWITPFYRPRRALINALINDNTTKLLWYDRKSAYFRNRERDCAYCRVECGPVRMRVTLERYVDPKTKEGVCVFLHGTDGTQKEERVVAEGPCLTWKQCDRLYAKVVAATPELDWYTE